jgi:hypothetical protein
VGVRCSIPVLGMIWGGNELDGEGVLALLQERHRTFVALGGTVFPGLGC